MASILLIFIYVFYIGLGIPDSLLGAAWPAIRGEFLLPISYAGFISVIISCGTVSSSLFSTPLIAKLGTSWMTVLSTCLTAIALLGFSCSHSFLWLCVSAIPLGIGAGAIDTALNNYVALHYTSMQINFLHCFYGVGVAASPYLMSLALTKNLDWRGGYRTVFFIQSAIVVLSILGLPVWKKAQQAQQQEEDICVLSLWQMLKRKKIWASCGVYVGTSALEAVCFIWGSSFLSEGVGMSPDMAAAMVTFYFVGMTLGRFLSGLFTIKYSSWQIIFGGQTIIFIAILLLLLWKNIIIVTGAGLFLIGLGNGPIFPIMTHLTPKLYSKETSQSVIGIQMAFSNLSIMLAPVLFGLGTNFFTVSIFPNFLLVVYLLMISCTMALKSFKVFYKNH